MEEDISIEYILVIPHNQFRFRYIINDGKIHSIRKEKLLKFLEPYLGEHVRKSIDFIQRFRPFIIDVKEKEVFELKKEDSNLTNEKIINFEKIIKTFKQEEKEEHIANDNLLEKTTKRVLSIFDKSF